MIFPTPISLDQLLSLFHHTVNVIGHSDRLVVGLNECHSVQDGELTFADRDKYYKKVLGSKASFVLLNKELDEYPEDKVIIISEDPLLDYLSVVNHYVAFHPQTEAIHPDTQIGEGTVIQPLVFIGEDVKIGKNCIIHSNVSIYGHTVIGDNVVIHSNTTIGGDACYFQKRPDRWVKFDSCGDVYIGSNIEIGCNCCIDRGVSGTTYIGDGTIFDNFVQIGHDTHIGKRVLLGAQSGIAGCTFIDDDCKIWAKASVNSNVYMAKNTVLYALSAVDKNIQEEGRTLFGVPADDVQKKWKEMAYHRNLSTLFEEVALLKKELESRK